MKYNGAPKNWGTRWTPAERENLKYLYRQGRPISEIAKMLGRSDAATYRQLQVLREMGEIEIRPRGELTGKRVTQTRTRMVGFSPARFKEIRESRGFTINELAKESHLPPGLIASFERTTSPNAPYIDNPRGEPSVAERLASVLGCSVEDFKVKPRPSVTEPYEDRLARVERKLDRLLEALGEAA